MPEHLAGKLPSGQYHNVSPPSSILLHHKTSIRLCSYIEIRRHRYFINFFAQFSLPPPKADIGTYGRPLPPYLIFVTFHSGGFVCSNCSSQRSCISSKESKSCKICHLETSNYEFVQSIKPFICLVKPQKAVRF